MEKEGLEVRCPYCREPLTITDEEIDQHLMKRVKANDPAALFQMGQKCDDEGDREGAFQYWAKAAKLGDMDAHDNLAIMYSKGEGVEKDQKKELYHLEEAAIGGHPKARYNLGVYERDNRRFVRAVKHWIIAANLGNDESMKTLREDYARGNITKEVYAATLRSYQDAVVGMKSVQRKEAVDAKW